MQSETVRKALAASRQGHFKRLFLRNNGKSLYVQFKDGLHSTGYVAYLGLADTDTKDYLSKRGLQPTKE
jgi:hypothetical protein